MEHLGQKRDKLEAEHNRNPQFNKMPQRDLKKSEIAAEQMRKRVEHERKIESELAKLLQLMQREERDVSRGSYYSVRRHFLTLRSLMSSDLIIRQPNFTNSSHSTSTNLSKATPSVRKQCLRRLHKREHFHKTIQKMEYHARSDQAYSESVYGLTTHPYLWVVFSHRYR